MRTTRTILAATLCLAAVASSPASARSHGIHRRSARNPGAAQVGVVAPAPLGFLETLFGSSQPVATVTTSAPFSRRRARTSTVYVPGAFAHVARAAAGFVGKASFYSGGRTASGGSVGYATCAHRTLPFGTRVRVTNLANNRQAVLVVNDRGPFVRGRIVDVSRGAAGVLGMIGSGVASVRVEVVASR